MLASSLREEAQMTVSNKPGHRGEHEVSRKTIARGMPGDFRCDRGDYTRVFFIYTRGCGRIERPAFPAPSVTGGREIQVKLARKPRRDREAVFAERCCLKSEVDPSTSVIASPSEAIHSQSNGDNGLLRRGACHRARIRATRWLLAMTASIRHRSQ